jgi:tetratricopeptide (TPR) repeat protein
LPFTKGSRFVLRTELDRPVAVLQRLGEAILIVQMLAGLLWLAAMVQSDSMVCVERALASKNAGQLAEAYSQLQLCAESAADQRSLAIVNVELGNIAAVYLDCDAALDFFDSAVDHMAAAAPDDDSVLLRVQYVKPAIYLLKAELDLGIAAWNDLEKHTSYTEKNLGYAMEDLGPVFSYAIQFLKRAKQSDSEDQRFSIHSNVGIKLLSYGADNLGLAHFKEGVKLDPTHAGMQVRVACAYPGIKNSLAELRTRRTALELNTRALVALSESGKVNNMNEPTFEIGYSSSFNACYDGVNDLQFMAAQWDAFNSLAPQLGRDGLYLPPSPPNPTSSWVPKNPHPHPYPSDEPANPKARQVLRVGFLSTNFRSHSVGKLFVGLLQQMRTVKNGGKRARTNYDARLFVGTCTG